MGDSTPVNPPPGFGPACAEIARAIVRSLEPADVIDRIAAASRLVIPFDAMGVWHAESPDDPVALTLGPGIAVGDSPPARPLRRADHSPRLWPDGDARPVCIGDAPRELDVAYAGDRYLVDHGYRSGTWSSRSRARPTSGSARTSSSAASRARSGWKRSPFATRGRPRPSASAARPRSC